MAALSMAGITLHAQQAGLRAVANGIADDIARSGKKSLAVVDFTDLQGTPTQLGAMPPTTDCA